MPRRSSDGYSPVSVLSNLGQGDRRPAIREWTPRNAEGNQPDALTLRAALLESNNAAAADLQQQVGVRTVLTRGRRRRSERTARCAVARARHRPRLAARSHRGLHDVPGRRGGRAPARHRRRLRRRRRRGVRAAGRTQAGHRRRRRRFRWSRCCGTSIDRGTGSAARALGVRGAGRRQDRNHRRVSRCVVRRLFVLGGRGRVGRLRSAGADRPRGVRRARRAADLGRLHEARREPAAGRRISPCPTASRPSSCAMCRICSRSTAVRSTREYFKDGDADPVAVLSGSPRDRSNSARPVRSKACSVRSAARSAGSSRALMQRSVRESAPLVMRTGTLPTADASGIVRASPAQRWPFCGTSRRIRSCPHRSIDAARVDVGGVSGRRGIRWATAGRISGSGRRRARSRRCRVRRRPAVPLDAEADGYFSGLIDARPWQPLPVPAR